jgi:hypothetical protein
MREQTPTLSNPSQCIQSEINSFTDDSESPSHERTGTIMTRKPRPQITHSRWICLPVKTLVRTSKHLSCSTHNNNRIPDHIVQNHQDASGGRERFYLIQVEIKVRVDVFPSAKPSEEANNTYSPVLFHVLTILWYFARTTYRTASYECR